MRGLEGGRWLAGSGGLAGNGLLAGSGLLAGNGLLEGNGGAWRDSIGRGGGNRESGVVGEHVQEEERGLRVECHTRRAHEGVVHGQLSRGRAQANHAQVVLRDGACFVGEDVAKGEWRRRSERDMSQFVDNAGISHANVFLVLFEAIQITLHEERLKQEARR